MMKANIITAPEILISNFEFKECCVIIALTYTLRKTYLRQILPYTQF